MAMADDMKRMAEIAEKVKVFLETEGYDSRYTAEPDRDGELSLVVRVFIERWTPPAKKCPRCYTPLQGFSCDCGWRWSQEGEERKCPECGKRLFGFSCTCGWEVPI
jgi:hypothetical protein